MAMSLGKSLQQVCFCLGVCTSASEMSRLFSELGVMTLFAGTIGVPSNVNGPCTSAYFTNPADVAVNSAGVLFVADSAGHKIRQISGGERIVCFVGMCDNGFDQVLCHCLRGVVITIMLMEWELMHIS
jgi:hypothetical protein